MQSVLYSHRLKTVLQHTVRDLGLTLSLDDENAGLSLADNRAMIAETAALLGLQFQMVEGDGGTTVTFYR
jgi:hypothetical protein